MVTYTAPRAPPTPRRVCLCRRPPCTVPLCCVTDAGRNVPNATQDDIQRVLLAASSDGQYQSL
jgi:hypothetical protein